MPTALARLIEQVLAKQDLSRTELAQALQITPVSVSRWLRESGDCPVPWRHYPELAQVLGVPLKRILHAAEQDHPDHVRLFHRFVFLVRTQLTSQSRRTG